MAPGSGAAAPLILTLAMDERSQERFDRLRETHFPPERNHLSAHLTLFHRLPGERQTAISADLREVCREQEPLTRQRSSTGDARENREEVYSFNSQL